MKENLYDHFKDHLLWAWDPHLPGFPGALYPEGNKQAVKIHTTS